MKHTRVPRTVRRDLAASYRNIVDTKPSRFLKPNPELGWKSNRKPKKTEWTKPIEKPKRRKQKNPHTFPTLKYLNLGRLMRCNVCEKYEPFCKKKKNDRRNSICFIRYFRPNTSTFETQTLYQHQSALPYMGCCILPCSFTKEPMILGPIPQSRWRKKTWMYCPWWWLVMVVTPKMKSGRPII